MQVDPVPSPCTKSPPWHMNFGIYTHIVSHFAPILSFLPGDGEPITYDAVKPGPLVALHLAIDFALAGAELAEVLGGARDDVFV